MSAHVDTFRHAAENTAIWDLHPMDLPTVDERRFITEVMPCLVRWVRSEPLFFCVEQDESLAAILAMSAHGRCQELARLWTGWEGSYDDRLRLSHVTLYALGAVRDDRLSQEMLQALRCAIPAEGLIAHGRWFWAVAGSDSHPALSLVDELSFLGGRDESYGVSDIDVASRLSQSSHLGRMRYLGLDLDSPVLITLGGFQSPSFLVTHLTLYESTGVAFRSLRSTPLYPG